MDMMFVTIITQLLSMSRNIAANYLAITLFNLSHVLENIYSLLPLTQNKN